MNRIWTLIAVIVIAVFVLLRFLHIEADFPHHYTHSGALYTDEGWYSNAAVIYNFTGNWHVEGDFNPAVNLPVFPILQSFSFKLLGLSLRSARVVNVILFIFLLIILYIFIKTFADIRIALFSLFLISINFLVFIYSRIALLELPMTFFVVLSLFVASKRLPKWDNITIVSAALIYSTAFLTKTTAAFALPILAYAIWTKKRTIAGRLLGIVLFCFTTGVFIGLYHFLVVKSHWADYQFFTSLNFSARLQTDLASIAKGIARALYYGKTIDLILYPLTLIYAIFLFIFKRDFRKHTLFRLCLIWIVGYTVLIGLFNYVPPRYYLPMVIPLSIILAITIDHFISTRIKSIQASILFGAIVISLVLNAYRIVNYIQAPAYTWKFMIEDIKDRVEVGGERQPVLLGNFSNSISLATGLFSINDRLGTQDLDYKIHRYNPNYYVCLGDIDAEILHILSDYYHTERVAEYNVYDNYYTGEPVVLYRLVRR